MDLSFFEKYDIWAFIPEYKKGTGEVTRVTTSCGEDQVLYMNMRSFRINLCRFYSIDYALSRKKYGKLIGSINCIPLPVSNYKVFLQLKVREPKFKNDCAMGYMDLYSIAGLEQQKGRTAVIFRDERKLEVLYSIATVNKHIKNARLVLEHYRNEKGLGAYPQVLEKIYSNLEKPATKADIVILAKEILTLKNSLNVH